MKNSIYRGSPLLVGRLPGGRSGSGVLHSHVAALQLLLVLTSQPVHSALSVQLVPHLLVCLHESVKLSLQIIVLSLKKSSMLLQGLLLARHISIAFPHLLIGELLVIQVLSHHISLFLLVLKSDVLVSQLISNVNVPRLLIVDFFSQVVGFTHLLINVFSQ